MAARRLYDLARHFVGGGKAAVDEANKKIKMAKQKVAAELEATLAQCVKDGKVPNAIVYATNTDGSFKYHHATGFQHYGVNEEPVQDDPCLMLASQTKLLTAIAALKAVELGLIGLDDDVSSHIPELGRSKILTGFDDDEKPILVDRKNPITLRNLLTHSSGCVYSFYPKILEYQAQHDRLGPTVDFSATILDRYNHPLIFEPGTSWMYSPGLDWTSRLIERLSGQTLDEFEQQHLWKPLGVNSITFWPKKDPTLRDTIPLLVERGEDDKLITSTDDNINTHSVDCFGGHGGHARLSDYLKVMHSLLANDGKLLKPTSVDELFRPQLGKEAAEALNETFGPGNFSAFCPGDFNHDIPYQYALGGLVFLEDDEGRRKAGTLSWGGMFNLFWIIDRKADLAFTIGTQTLPPGDPLIKEVFGIAEKAVYKMKGVA